MILPLAAALLAGGCTTFSDQDAIARVGNVELKQEQLDEILPLVTSGTEVPPEAAAGATRTAISVWLEAQVFSQAVVSSGVELDQAALDESTARLSSQFADNFSTLSDGTRDLLVNYVTGLAELPALPRPDETAVAAWFNAGTSRSGIACVSHILVDTEEAANNIVAELDVAQDEGGNEAEFTLFADLASTQSTDLGSGANGGLLACDVSETIAQQYVPPFAEATLSARPGEPTEPVESDFGFHVIRLQTFAESQDGVEQFYETGYVQAQFAIDAADIRVDSRYGTAEGVNVIPLGG